MLKSLELENFKAFGRRTRVPLAPITLIFGENSAGKSSILQSLHLLKQTVESRDDNVLLLPRDQNGIVDLGGFNEMVFDHDTNRSLSIRLDANSDGVKCQGWNDLEDIFGCSPGDIGLEFVFFRPDPQAEVCLQRIKCFSSVVGDMPLAIYDSEQPLESQKCDDYGDTRRDLRCTYITSDRDFWEEEYKFRRQYSDRLSEYCKDVAEDLKADLRLDMEEGEEFPPFMKTVIDMKESAVEFYDRAFTLEDFVSYMKSLYTGDLAGLRAEQFLPRYTGKDCFEDPVLGIDMERVADRYNPLSEYKETLEVKECAERREVPIKFGGIIKEHLHSIFPMGPTRQAPERYYIFSGTSPQDVGYQGSSMPEFLFSHPEHLEKVNKWLVDDDKLDMGYKLEARSVGERNKDLFELRLLDTRRNEPDVDVGLPDVGYGISQLLPFIVQALTTEGQIISIEQPEVHIHPRLQADLGDLLAESAKEHNNQLLIETHSEHLVLRLQRLIRHDELSPEDVSVLYVSRTENGSRVDRLRLDEDGFFADEWPGGFFPERLDELV